MRRPPVKNPRRDWHNRGEDSWETLRARLLWFGGRRTDPGGIQVAATVQQLEGRTFGSEPVTFWRGRHFSRARRTKPGGPSIGVRGTWREPPKMLPEPWAGVNFFAATDPSLDQKRLKLTLLARKNGGKIRVRRARFPTSFLSQGRNVIATRAIAYHFAGHRNTRFKRPLGRRIAGGRTTWWRPSDNWPSSAWQSLMIKSSSSPPRLTRLKKQGAGNARSLLHFWKEQDRKAEAEGTGGPQAHRQACRRSGAERPGLARRDAKTAGPARKPATDGYQRRDGLPHAAGALNGLLPLFEEEDPDA